MRVAPLVMLALLIPVASADWLQDGGDAGRTGYRAEAGPAWPDVALRLAASARGEGLLVIGERAFYATDRATRIDALDLRTGETSAFWERPDLPTTGTLTSVVLPTFASDGDRIFVYAYGQLEAVDLEGKVAWTTTLAAGVTSPCHRMALAPDALLLACVRSSGVTSGVGARITLSEYDPATGAERWTWVMDSPTDLLDRVDIAPEARSAEPALYRTVLGLSVSAGRAFLSLVDADPGVGSAPTRCQPWLIAVDLETHRASDLSGDLWIGAEGTPCDARPAPVTDGEAAWFLAGGEVRLILEDQEVGIQRPPAARHRLRSNGFNGNAPARLSLDASSVYVPYDGTMWAFPRDLSAPRWSFDLPEGSQWSAGAVLAGNTLYAASDQGSLFAFDARTGRVLWREPSRVTALALDGARIVTLAERDLIVYGDLPFALRAASPEVNAYPALGEEVEIDLSATPASPLGASTSFAADWGDGTLVEWTSDPVLRHRYAANGDYIVRAVARNEANQTASISHTIYVGREPPGFLAAQFSAANQERTFFLLGLLITGAFAAAGLWRVQRRRSLLARELAALEATAAEARDDAVKLDRALDERRYRARSLLLDRKLDEGQHAVLLARVEELSRVERLGFVEGKLDFLPLRHAKALREMLKDGRISTIERAHYLAMLDADGTLTPDYKARVRDVVEAWAAHDGGAR